MATLAGIKMIVKNTFLEVDEAEEVEMQVRRCKTDPAVISFWSSSESTLSVDTDAESVSSERGRASSASVVSEATTSETLPTPTASEVASAGFAARTSWTGASDADVQPGGAPAETGNGAKSQGSVGRAAGAAGRTASGAQHARTRTPDEGAACEPPPRAGCGPSTVMLRNLPNDYTRSMLLELLDEHGFATRYDFAYMPMDFTRRAGLGYAFVNMTSAADARAVRRALEGFRRWSLPSAKVCSVGWSMDQGLDANIERYRNSPVMHPSVPDEYKPVLLRHGVCADFPEPTKKVRKPNLRKSGR